MIRKQRLVRTFLELVKIPGLSRQEERIAAEVKKRLERLGGKVTFDREILKQGFPVGNMITRFNGARGEPLILNAHLDTVGPAEKINYRRRGDIIQSAGKSILGADDRAGVAVILEVIEHLKESGVSHPPIEVVFTMGEEIGLVGAKHLEYKRLRGRHALVLDGGKPSEVITRAPQAYRMVFRVIGKESHAGIHPEDGVNAITVASDGISRMKIGRIDFETTANIGVIEGGRATNIVPALVEVRGEARSHDMAKVKRQVAHMRAMMQQAVKKHRRRAAGGGKYPRLEEEIYFDYPAMRVDENGPVMRAVREGAKRAGIRVTTRAGGGGSDANIFNSRGIESAIIGTGMEKVHTTKERIRISRLYKSALLVSETAQAFVIAN